MKDSFGKQNYNVAYVDELPDCCMNCPFMCVDNKVWYNGTYNATQWCSLRYGEDYEWLHLEEGWRDKRDDNCPLKTVSQLLDVVTTNTYYNDVFSADLCYYLDSNNSNDCNRKDDTEYWVKY